MKSRSPRLYLRVRELAGQGRLRHGEHKPARLYSMTYAPRYGLKTTLSTRRTLQTVRDWAPYV